MTMAESSPSNRADIRRRTKDNMALLAYGNPADWGSSSPVALRLRLAPDLPLSIAAATTY